MGLQHWTKGTRPWTRWSPERKQLLKDFYERQCLKVSVIAEIFKTSVAAIRYNVMRFGFHRGQNTKLFKKAEPLTAPQKSGLTKDPLKRLEEERIARYTRFIQEGKLQTLKTMPKEKRKEMEKLYANPVFKDKEEVSTLEGVAEIKKRRGRKRSVLKKLNVRIKMIRRALERRKAKKNVHTL